MPEIYWSCLSSKTDVIDPKNLTSFTEAGIDKIHCDISSNKKTIDVDDIRSIRQTISFPLDLHLAVDNWIDVILEIRDLLQKDDCLSVQAEMLEKGDFKKFRELVASSDCELGLAVMPNFYSDDCIKQELNNFSRCTVMAVTPGVAGMSFDYEAVRCINFVRDNYHECHICLDGGVNEKTVRLVSNLGVDSVVSGSFLSSFATPSDAINLISKNLTAKNGRTPKVGDLIDHAIPLLEVESTDRLQMVLHKITSGGLGMISVKDKKGIAIGIISDGDVRRTLYNDMVKPQLTAKDIVNDSPLCFSTNDEIGKLLELFCLDVRFDRPLVKTGGGYKVLPLNVVLEKLL